MDATLSDIDAAIFATLEGLLASAGNGGTFVAVDRYSGETTGRDPQLHAAAPSTPAILLALESETYQLAAGLDTIPMRQIGFVATSTWRVFVVHSELAGYGDAVTGQAGDPGILGLLSTVVRALAGLRIPGLYRNARLMPVDAKPVHIKPGQFIYLARFSAQRFVDSVPIVDDSVPLEQIGINTNVAVPVIDASGNIVGVSVDETVSPLVSFEFNLT